MITLYTLLLPPKRERRTRIEESQEQRNYIYQLFEAFIGGIDRVYPYTDISIMYWYNN